MSAKKEAWFKFYEGVVHDPKVQRLVPALFKSWVNLLCVASANDGALPPTDDLAFILRCRPEKVDGEIKALEAAGLFDRDHEGMPVPHGWDMRQDGRADKSVSTDRVKRFRERQRNASETASETLDETIGETQVKPLARGRDARESLGESRAEEIRAEQTRNGVTSKETKRSRIDLDAIEAACRSSAGLSDDPSPNLLDLSPIVALLDAGYNLDRDVLPVLRSKASSGHRVRSWRYFVQAIENGHTANAQIKPKANGHAETKPLNGVASRRGPSGSASGWEEIAALCRKHAKPDGWTLWDAMRWGIPEQIPAEHRHLFAGLVIEGQLMERAIEPGQVAKTGDAA